MATAVQWVVTVRSAVAAVAKLVRRSRVSSLRHASQSRADLLSVSSANGTENGLAGGRAPSWQRRGVVER